MFELTINDAVYEFNFGIGFVREINKTAQTESINGIKEDIGLSVAIAEIATGDVVALVDVLNLANKGRTPRVTQKALEGYVEDENTDVDKLFDMVLDFFGKANATKRQAKRVLEAIKTES